jgi:osmoprotectant transport system ATP-binding protein
MNEGKIVADASPRELLSGQAGPEANAMVAVPREQAERLAAFLQ